MTSFLRGFIWHNFLLMLYIQQVRHNCYLCVVWCYRTHNLISRIQYDKTRVFYKTYAANGF